jgi:hypothetical protein
MRFYDRWGQRLRPVAQLPPGDHSRLPQDHAIGADTCAGGEREDVELEDVVDALIRHHGNGGSRTRTCERTGARLRGSSALPYQLGHASVRRKFRVRARELCRDGARGVAGRNRTCAAPLFRRALYRAELRPREIGWRSRNRIRPAAFGLRPSVTTSTREALHRLSYAPSGYSSLRHARGSSGWGFGVRSSRKE